MKTIAIDKLKSSDKTGLLPHVTVNKALDGNSVDNGSEKSVRATRANRDLTLNRFTADEQGRIIRFCEMLSNAKELQRISEREMADRLGITLGTSQKYFSYQVLPEKVNVSTMAKLAALNKISVDRLLAYIQTGDMSTKTSLLELLHWLRNADKDDSDLAEVAEALAETLKSRSSIKPLERRPALQPYTWPSDFLKQLGIKKEWFPNFGFTEEQLNNLLEKGEFSDELVEAFAKLCDPYDITASDVRWSFENREPLMVDDMSSDQ